MRDEMGTMRLTAPTRKPGVDTEVIEITATRRPALYSAKYLTPDTYLRIHASATQPSEPLALARMSSGTSVPAPTNTPPAAALTSDASDERRRLAARVLADSLLLGIVGDALLRTQFWGANMTLWSIAIVVALVTLARRRYDTIPTDARWLMMPAVAIALMFTWRDADSLAAYNTLAVAGTIALLASAVAAGPTSTVIDSRLRDLIQRAVNVGIGALFGMLPLVFSDVSFRQVTNARGAGRVIAGVRAALIAIPLLLVFGGLFASADPVFARIISDAFRIDTELVASHLLLIGFLSWVIGGVLRSALLATARSRFTVPFPDGALGLTEVSVALGSLVLLFAAFVAVQARYFFGGQALVQQTAGMSYADYARHGFFELVTVAALVLPVLLSANALLRRDTPRAALVYRALASTLLVLLAVIMYSAIARMRLYQSVYGLSTDRLYATVFMAWLAVVFGWFAVTVLRGREKPFVAGLLVSGWGTLIALNVADPAGLVARGNIARAERGKALDVPYIASLGADAAPALVNYLVRQPLTPPAGWAPQAPQTSGASVAPTPTTRAAADSLTGRSDFTARCQAARRLLNQWGSNTTRDWRGWNLGSTNARRVVRANEASLRTLGGKETDGTNYIRCAEAPAPLPAPTN
jgi:hypothetical protein